MLITTATIDCWLVINGTNHYTEFEHHHWDIGPSGMITAALGNTLTYTWSVNGFGGDTSGSWSEISQSKTVTNGATVRIDPNTSPPNLVSLTQATNRAQLPATGNTHANDHQVDERTWPPDLTWDANHPAGATTFSDMGQPTFQLVFGPGVVVSKEPRLQKPKPKPVGSIAPLASMTLNLVPGTGGRDYTAEAKRIWQNPAGSTARIWWAWIVNLM